MTDFTAPGGAPAPVQPDVAGFGKRLLGGLVDLVVVGIFTGIMFVMFGEDTNAAENAVNYSITGLPAVVLFLGNFLYFVVLEGMSGRTLGKRVVGTVVVKKDGSSIGFGQAIGRTIFRVVDFACCALPGIIAIVASKQNQRIGDMVSGTIVVTR